MESDPNGENSSSTQRNADELSLGRGIVERYYASPGLASTTRLRSPFMGSRFGINRFLFLKRMHDRWTRSAGPHAMRRLVFAWFVPNAPLENGTPASWRVRADEPKAHSVLSGPRDEGVTNAVLAPVALRRSIPSAMANGKSGVLSRRVAERPLVRNGQTGQERTSLALNRGVGDQATRVQRRQDRAEPVTALGGQGALSSNRAARSECSVSPRQPSTSPFVATATRPAVSAEMHSAPFESESQEIQNELPSSVMRSHPAPIQSIQAEHLKQTLISPMQPFSQSASKGPQELGSGRVVNSVEKGVSLFSPLSLNRLIFASMTLETQEKSPAGSNLAFGKQPKRGMNGPELGPAIIRRRLTHSRGSEATLGPAPFIQRSAMSPSTSPPRAAREPAILAERPAVKSAGHEITSLVEARRSGPTRSVHGTPASFSKPEPASTTASPVQGLPNLTALGKVLNQAPLISTVDSLRPVTAMQCSRVAEGNPVQTKWGLRPATGEDDFEFRSRDGILAAQRSKHKLRLRVLRSEAASGVLGSQSGRSIPAAVTGESASQFRPPTMQAGTQHSVALDAGLLHSMIQRYTAAPLASLKYPAGSILGGGNKTEAAAREAEAVHGSLPANLLPANRPQQMSWYSGVNHFKAPSTPWDLRRSAVERGESASALSIPLDAARSPREPAAAPLKRHIESGRAPYSSNLTQAGSFGTAIFRRLVSGKAATGLLVQRFGGDQGGTLGSLAAHDFAWRPSSNEGTTLVTPESQVSHGGPARESTTNSVVVLFRPPEYASGQVHAAPDPHPRRPARTVHRLASKTGPAPMGAVLAAASYFPVWEQAPSGPSGINATLQRAPLPTAYGRSQSAPGPPFSTGFSGGPVTGFAGADIAQLADHVYNLLVRRIANESERRGV